MEHKPSSLRDYGITFLIALILFVILGSYLYIRRGYMFDAPPTADIWYVPNKVIAGVAVMMLSLTFLVGPITRYFDKFDQWVGYRKEIGIVGGLLAILHGVLSYFFSPKKFPSSVFLSEERITTFLPGLFGAVLLAALLVISLKIMIEKLGGARWWFLQRWGIRLVVLFTLLHVIPMKWEGWKKWYVSSASQTPELLNPWMTPASILVMLFMVWVVIVRSYETLFLFRSSGMQAREIVADPILKQRGRRFFLGSFFVLLILYVLVLTRWMGNA